MLQSKKNTFLNTWNKFFVSHSKRESLDYLPQRSSDVFICSYERSGTTWMQMILFQLFTDGDIDSVNHIEDFSPNISGYNAEAIWKARLLMPYKVYKHHGYHHQFSKDRAGKYIYVMRNGMDVCLSLYHHYKAYGRWDTEKGLDEFFEFFLTRKDFNWFEHLKGWHTNEGELDILVVKYEDLSTRPDQILRRVANFCEIELSEKKLERALERSNFHYMKKHQEKFGMQPSNRGKRDVITYNQFIRKGEMYEGEEMLSEEQKIKYNEYLEKYQITDYAYKSNLQLDLIDG